MFEEKCSLGEKLSPNEAVEHKPPDQALPGFGGSKASGSRIANSGHASFSVSLKQTMCLA